MSHDTNTLIDAFTTAIINHYVPSAFDRLRRNPEMAEVPIRNPQEARELVMAVIEEAEPIDPENAPIEAEAREMAVEQADWARVGNILADQVDDYLEAEARDAFNVCVELSL